MYTRLAYLLGFSALFPSVALFHVGATTGIQFSLFFALILFYLTLTTGARTPRFWFFLLSTVLIETFFWHVLDNDHNELLIKNFIAFSLCLMFVWIGSQWTTDRLSGALDAYIKGYTAAAIFSALFAIFQFTVWKVLGLSSGIAMGFRNNQGFGDLSKLEVVDWATYGRAFGFCSEPSVLALLLTPALMILLAQKKRLLASIVLLGVLATQSLTSYLFLVLLIVYLVRLRGDSKFATRNLLLTMTAIVVGLGALLTSETMQLRVGDLGADASTVSRLNSLLSGWDAILERPFFGWGIQADDLNEFISLRSTIFEENPNIHSLAMSFTAWFGVPAFLIFMAPCIRFSLFLHKKIPPSTAVFLAASIWPAFLTLNYFNIYSIWLAFGVASGYALRKQRSDLDPVAPQTMRQLAAAK